MIIEIVGTICEGKTTLALALEEFLKSKGFENVSVTDPDCVYEGQFDRQELQEMRVQALVEKGTSIHITTRQLPLDSMVEATKDWNEAKDIPVNPEMDACGKHRLAGVCAVHHPKGCSKK